MATLLLEVLQTRILSFMLFPSLVFIVVSFAMLGFGVSGATLAVSPPTRWKNPRGALALLALGFSLSGVLGMVILGRFPLPAFQFMHDPANLVMLVAYYVVFTVPYYFSGLCLGVLFTLKSKRITTLYSVDLTGSGIGCLVLVWAIFPLGGEGTLVLAAALGIAASLAFAIRGGKVALLSGALAAVACGVIAYTGPRSVIELRVDPTKELGWVVSPLVGQAGEIEYTGWSPISRTDVASAKWMEKDSTMIHLLGKQWPTKMVSADGGAYTPMVGSIPDEMIAKLRQNHGIMYGFRMLGYYTKEHPDTLIIGCGGGSDVIAAKIHEASHITAVDLNPITIRVMKGEFASFNGNLYNDPNIEVYAAEGRSFVSRSDHKFSNIHMNGVDTLNALAAGANVTAENYLYSVEAMADYLHHLQDDGFLTIARLSFPVPRETIKLCTAMISAFEKLNIPNPEDHIIVICDRYSSWATFLCKKSPLTQADLDTYLKELSNGPFRIYYMPKVELPDDTQDVKMARKYYNGLFRASKHGTMDAFFASYPYDIRPATDDRPYFFKIHKADAFLNPLKTVTPYEKNFGLVALIILLAQSVISALILIIWPLIRFHREGLRVPHRVNYLVYFMGLGLAFMLIELSLLQKLSLLLGHPTYSIAVGLTSLLIFSGVGSFLSGVVRLPIKTLVLGAAIAIAAIIVVYVPALPLITTATLAMSPPARVIIAAAILAPLALFMGMLFPAGIRFIARDNSRFVPWAWGVNGVSSVIGSVVCIFLSMSYGFTPVMLLGVCIYLVAAMSLVMARISSEATTPAASGDTAQIG
jgi:spermidine synthase